MKMRNNQGTTSEHNWHPIKYISINRAGYSTCKSYKNGGEFKGPQRLTLGSLGDSGVKRLAQLKS